MAADWSEPGPGRPSQILRRQPGSAHTELFTCTVGRGILPIIFERLKILFRPLYPSLRPGEGVKDRLTGQSVEPSRIIREAKIFLYG